jgi:hypothetical protein
MSLLFHKSKTAQIALLIFFVIGVTGEVRSERKNSWGTSVNFVGGGSNQVGAGSSLRGADLSAFYSLYPSIMLSSAGEHSTINLDYHFAVDRSQMDKGVTDTSHRFSGVIESQLGNRSRFKLSGNMNSMSDYSMINVLKGIISSPGEFQYIYEPEFFKRSNISSGGSMGLDVNLTDKSFLTFAGSGNYRFYKNATAINNLSDQLRVEGSFSYSRKATDHSTWNLKYTVRQNDYQKFATSRSHSITLGLAHRLSPKWQFNLNAGSSFVEKSDPGYEIDANISRQSHGNNISAGYSHHVAESTGLGGSTDTHQGNMSFSQTLGRSTSIELDAAAFKQKLYDSWGSHGALALSQQLGRYWALSLGGSYQGDNGRSSKRFYVSLNFAVNKKTR